VIWKRRTNPRRIVVSEKEEEEEQEKEKENADYLEHHTCTFWHKRVNFAFLVSFYRISTALQELRMRRSRIYRSCAHEYI
jgi:hypothetical protein